MKYFIGLLCFFFSVVESKEWNYLNTAPLHARYAIAAHYLKNCSEVIEIGGYKTPIDLFLQNHSKVYVIDPLISPKCTEDVIYYNCSLKNSPKFIPESPFGLVILGLCLQDMDADTYAYLYELVDKATTVVIEFSSEWQPAKEMFDRILNNSKKKISISIGLDFTKNPIESGPDGWPPLLLREMYVLE